MAKKKRAEDKNIEIKTTLTTVTRLMLISGLFVFLITYLNP